MESTTKSVTDHVATLIRGADGYLYEVFAETCESLQSSVVKNHGADEKPAFTVQSGDRASARNAIDPGDHASARNAIDPGDHASARNAIDPGDHASARNAIDPGDQMAA